jgi:general secretion pathway protein J
MRHYGFTLVELLIALAIAAIISVGTLFLFNTSLNSKDVVEEQSTVFAQTNRMMRIVEQDFIQLSPFRSVRDPYGEFQKPIQLTFEGLFFTRNGWANSRLLPTERSTLQRVHYRLAEPGSDLCPWLENEEENDLGGCLIRSYKTHLDDDGSLNWQHQVIFRPIKEVDWEFLVFDPQLNSADFKNQPPEEDPRDGLQRTRLLGVRVQIETGYGSVYQRLIQTPTVPPLVEEEGV